MKVKTYLSTDWIEVHDKDYVYIAKIFLTDDDTAYMITVSDGRKKFFKVDANLVKTDELEFFEKVLRNSKELPLKHAYKIGLIDY